MFDFNECFYEKTYIVQDSETQRFSSTHVSGGEASVSSSSYGGVHVAQSPIKSQVSIHCRQDIWVVDPVNGVEKCLKLNDFDVSFRPGHTVKVIVDKKTGVICRVINANTGEWSASNSYCPKASIANIRLLYHGAACLLTLLSITVFLPILTGLMALAILIKPNKNLVKDVLDAGLLANKYLLSTSIIVSLVALYVISFGGFGFMFIVAFIGYQITAWYYVKVDIANADVRDFLNNRIQSMSDA